MSSSWRCGGLLLAIVVVAAALRLYRLESPYFFSDEAFSWRVASRPLLGLLHGASGDTHPPGHFLLLKAWMAIFGDSTFALRSLSALGGVLVVPLIYLVVLEGAGGSPGARAGGLLGASLAAVNVVQITYSRVARMYSWGAALAALSTWLLLRALREDARGGWRWWGAYGASAALFLLMHNFALFTLAAHALFIVVYCIHRGRLDSWRRARETLAGFAFAVGLAAAVFSPWAPVFLEQARRTHERFWIAPFSARETISAVVQWNFGHVVYGVAAGVCVAVLLVAVVTAFVMLHDAGRLLALSFATPWLLAIAVSTLGGRPLLQERYFIFAGAALWAMLGLLVASIPRRLPRAAFGFALLGVSVGPSCMYLTRLPAHPPVMEQAVAWLASQHRAGDVVTVSIPSGVNVVRYYAAQSNWDVDVRVYVRPGPSEGQMIHTSSLTSRDLLADPRGAPSASAARWWRLHTDKPRLARPAPAPWSKRISRSFEGPRAVRGMGSGEMVLLECYEHATQRGDAG